MVTFHRHRPRKASLCAICCILLFATILSLFGLSIADLHIGYLEIPPTSELTSLHIIDPNSGQTQGPGGLPSKSEEVEAYGSTLPYISAGGCEAPGCTINFPKKLTLPLEPKSEFNDAVSTSDQISGHCTLRGQKGVLSPNQDRSVLIETPHGFLAGLFDGHGTKGETSSTIALQVLPASIIGADVDIITDEMIHTIFRNADSEVMEAKGGTTAFVIFQQHDKIHIAWVGDSSAYVVHWLDEPGYASMYKPVLHTVPHKPADPEERNRIESRGGRVFVPLNPDESSRVFYLERDDIGGQLEFGLAMSRSLGDKGGKLSQVLTAKPSILSFDFPRSGDYFVVLASDGVGDVIPEEDLLIKLGETMFSNNGQSLDEVCQEIVSLATDVWNRETGGSYRDDISLLFRKVQIRPASGL